MMFTEEQLNSLDYTFAFLGVKKSSSLLDKLYTHRVYNSNSLSGKNLCKMIQLALFPQKEIVVSAIRQLSPHCGENSVFNSVRTAYTIQNQRESVKSAFHSSYSYIIRNS